MAGIGTEYVLCILHSYISYSVEYKQRTEMVDVKLHKPRRAVHATNLKFNLKVATNAL